MIDLYLKAKYGKRWRIAVVLGFAFVHTNTMKNSFWQNFNAFGPGRKCDDKYWDGLHANVISSGVVDSVSSLRFDLFGAL